MDDAAIRARANLLLEARSCSYSLSMYFRKSAARYLVMLVSFGVILLGCWLQPVDFIVKVTCFFTGWACAVVWRDTAWVRGMRAAWPFTELVTDWNKVQELAGLSTVNPHTATQPGRSDSN